MEKIDLLLINPPFHRRSGGGSIFPLGLGYIISEIQSKGFKWKIIDCTTIISSYYKEDLSLLEKELRVILKKYNPNAVGIGPCVTSQLKALKVIADCCIEQFGQERIYAGGPLASITGQEWVFYELLKIKYIMKGDGEYATTELLQILRENGKISDCEKITTAEHTFFNEIENLNEIKFPFRYNINQNKVSERRSPGNDKIKTASMITSRGCIYHCYYCVSGNMQYKKFRKRSSENVVAEIKELNTIYGINDIIFYDDCFFYKFDNIMEDIKEFSEQLQSEELHISWQMEIRMDWLRKLTDEEILLLEKCGCRLINIGIEKTTQEGLEYLGKRSLIHGIAQVINHIKEISSIKVAGTFILGGGMETEEDIWKTIKESKQMSLDYAQYNPLFIYPGTKLYKERFADEREWAYYILGDDLPWGEIVYENKFVSRTKLLELVEAAYQYFYNDTKLENSMMVQDRFNLRRESNNEDI